MLWTPALLPILLTLYTNAQKDRPAVTGYRLVNGKTATEGRLEVRIDGVWGMVCDELFDHVVAVVACRTLGLTGGVPKTQGYFGAGTGPIHMDNITCKGSEQCLAQCAFLSFQSSLDGGDPDCGHMESAGVICGQSDSAGSKACPNVTIELAGGGQGGGGDVGTTTRTSSASLKGHDGLKDKGTTVLTGSRVVSQNTTLAPLSVATFGTKTTTESSWTLWSWYEHYEQVVWLVGACVFLLLLLLTVCLIKRCGRHRAEGSGQPGLFDDLPPDVLSMGESLGSVPGLEAIPQSVRAEGNAESFRDTEESGTSFIY